MVLRADSQLSHSASVLIDFSSKHGNCFLDAKKKFKAGIFGQGIFTSASVTSVQISGLCAGFWQGCCCSFLA